SCQASSATSSRWRMIRSAGDCSTFPSSRGRRRSQISACPTCCCRATTPRFGDGGNGKRWHERWSAVRTYWPGRLWTKKRNRYCRNCGNYSTAGLQEAVMGAIELVEKSQLAERPAMKSGDTVKVHVKVREGDKERIQIFEGVVIGVHRGGTRA